MKLMLNLYDVVKPTSDVVKPVIIAKPALVAKTDVVAKPDVVTIC
jgi:hypothetical protein